MINVRKNYGNNGIYGRVSNFFGTSCLDPAALSLRSGKITCGYEAPGVAPLPRKLPSANFPYPPDVARKSTCNDLALCITAWDDEKYD